MMDAYHSVNRESQFDPFTITKLEGLMSSNELICQNANKLVASQMVDEIEKLIREMRTLIESGMPQKWPEVCICLARLRGYAFLGFRIAHAHHEAAVPKAPASKPKPTIDDLI